MTTMSKNSKNPLDYAIGEINTLLNSHGYFTFLEQSVTIPTIRIRFQQQMYLRLALQANYQGHENTTLWYWAETDSYIRLRDWRDGESGDVTISSKSHEGLIRTIQLYRNDTQERLDETISYIIDQEDE